jgi:uncharacterized SAM-binding protein YcdF (DUF218 family)
MRLVAVLGYSPRRGDGLHDVCAARIRHARAVLRNGDGVLLTGEAELMRGAWAGEDVLLDPHARNTRENAVAIAAAVHELGATDVVVVTSRWHAFRARTLVRAALREADVNVTSSSPPGWHPLTLLAREAACLTVLPLHVILVRASRIASWTRRRPRSGAGAGSTSTHRRRSSGTS